MRSLLSTDQVEIVQSGNAVTFNFADGISREIVVDGKEDDDILDNGALRTVKSRWKNGKLVVQTKVEMDDRKSRLTETWTLSPEADSLSVTLKNSAGPMAGVEILRVYNRQG